MSERHRSGNTGAEWRRSFWGRDVDRDINDELRFHLEMRERDFLAAGMSPEQAHEAARARFGDVHDVTTNLRAHDLRKQRQERRVEVMGNLAQDIRYGVRKLVQAPGFSAAVVLILALGIGINSAIFSAVDAAMLRPLPFADTDRLMLLEGVNFPAEMRMSGPPREKRSPDISDVQAMQDVVQEFGAYTPGGLNLGGNGNPTRVKIAIATPGLFTMLGATPLRGRTFVEAEGKPGAPDVVLLSEGLWKRQYGGDAGIIGRAVLLNDVPHTVVGIMPENFVFPAGTELWIPMPAPFSWSGTRREALRSFFVPTKIVKLKPGVSAATAGKRVRALFDPYATADSPIEYTAEELVQPLQQILVKNRRTALLVLMGAAVLVLLTACANVTNLLLSRAAQRRREIGIRAALGASRVRIVQQLLTESVLLSALGGIVGVALAFGALGLLATIMPAQLVDVAPPRIDMRVLAFSLVVSMLSGLVFGLWPAFGATRKHASHTANLRQGGHGATGGDGRALRRIFVVSEMAFALLLLVGAGLMLRSFRELLTTNSGVEIERVASMELSLPKSRYKDAAAIRAFHQQLLQRLQGTPGVEAAASINEVPLRGEYGIGLSVEAEGKVRPKDDKGLYPQYLRVTPDYFRAMGIRMLAGRSLNAQDDEKHPGAVINKTMADALWPGENAVGLRFAFGTMPGEQPEYITVVGVIADVRSQSIEMAPSPQMYLSFIDSPTGFAGIVARGTGDARTMVAALRNAVRAVDAQQAVYNLQTLDQTVSKNIAPRRTNTILFATFGALAVVLAAFGVYAVIANGVAQRSREIGIRIALGAEVRSIMRMVMREGLLLGIAGIVIGLAGAWALTRIMESLLFGVSAHDPFTFVAASALLLVVALAASYLPARAASRVDPIKTIRTE